MRVLILAFAALVASVAMSQEYLDLSRIGKDAPEGFGGFAFGSTIEFVEQEQARDGWTIDRRYAGWIWYVGEIEGCRVEYGYDFDHSGRLESGLFVVTNSHPCFHSMQQFLLSQYGSDVSLIAHSGSFEMVLTGYFTRIVHKKNNEFHTVSFYNED